jgi:Mg-chelatase subunit ChlI
VTVTVRQKALAAYENRTEVTVSDIFVALLPCRFAYRLRKDPMSSIAAEAKSAKYLDEVFGIEE